MLDSLYITFYKNVRFTLHHFLFSASFGVKRGIGYGTQFFFLVD